MEEGKEQSRLDEIKTIRNYKVLQLVRKVGVRGTFAVESKTNPGNIFSISVLDMPYAKYFEGAQFVHFLLGTATVSLAIPIYKGFASLKGRMGVLLLSLNRASPTLALPESSFSLTCHTASQAPRSDQPASSGTMRMSTLALPGHFSITA